MTILCNGITGLPEAEAGERPPAPTLSLEWLFPNDPLFSFELGLSITIAGIWK
jgi:hypothetical protein